MGLYKLMGGKVIRCKNPAIPCIESILASQVSFSSSSKLYEERFS